jgi:NAD-dependent SIR2 family protein deacetylase
MVDDDVVTFADGLPAIPEKLLLARDRGEVLFITGAGISRPAPSSLPDFRELVVEVYDRLDTALAAKLHTIFDEEQSARAVGKVPRTSWTDHIAGLNAAQQAELRAFTDDEFDVVLGMLERRLEAGAGNASSMRKAVSEILARTQQTNDLHASLARLGQRFGRPFIATTNFDPLLGAAASRRRLSPKIYALGAMPRPSRRKEFEGIFHLHGALPRGDTSSDLVLTDQDFGDVYLRRRIAAEFIYDAARIFHLVLVGYSLSDAPMRYLMNAIAGDETHFADIKTRYAIIPAGNDRAVDIAYWLARGIVPIAYDQRDNHRQLQSLMSEWAESIPLPAEDSWSRRQIRRITHSAVEAASEIDRSLFRYIVRRATPSERETFAGLLRGRGSSGRWLGLINEITRQDLAGPR